MADENTTPTNAATPVEGITQNGSATTYTPTEEEQARQPAPPETPQPERPSVWPEGVNSWDEFGKLTPEEQAAAYAPKEEPAKESTTEEDPTGVKAIVDQSLEGVAPEMADKARPFVQAFAETGTLTDEQVTEAAKATGFSEEMIRQYMAGGETIAAQAVEPVYALVGGADHYGDFQAWANEALGPDDHAKINTALGLSEDGLRVVGVPNAELLKDYADTYKASGRGPAPRDLTTEARSPGSQEEHLVDAFGSQEEQTRAINDPRYRTDPSYRKQVEAKIGRSNF